MANLDDAKTEKAAQTEVTSPSASDRDVSNISSPVDVQPQAKKSWKSYVWDTFDKSPEERRFLFKLDLALMTLASLGYFIKYLDQASLNMNEDTQRIRNRCINMYSRSILTMHSCLA